MQRLVGEHIRTGLVLCAALLGAGSMILAADGQDGTSDWNLATQARAALWNDPELATLNLEVVVRNGVATVSGAVSAAHFRQQAVELVQQIRGIKAVDNLIAIRGTVGWPGLSPRNRGSSSRDRGFEDSTPATLSAPAPRHGRPSATCQLLPPTPAPVFVLTKEQSFPPAPTPTRRQLQPSRPAGSVPIPQRIESQWQPYGGAPARPQVKVRLLPPQLITRTNNGH